VALIGDSHAFAMGSALDRVAYMKGWTGVGITHNGCAFSAALEAFANAAYVTACADWVQGVMQWLRAHPEVTSVFVTSNDHFGYQTSSQTGFQDAWRALPRSVRNIFVIRDAPTATPAEQACVREALAREDTYAIPYSIGVQCSVPWYEVLVRDREVAAAASSRMSRVHVINLRSFYCGSRCYPVIGGVLVLVDLQHVSEEFSATLAPYIVRAITAAASSRRRPTRR
jgi:hypothetical protein